MEADQGPPPTRWEVELEFVQSLANPMYVHFLAQSKYFDDSAFLSYLEYLEYWRKPENATFLVYPNCLHMLTLLKQPSFREEIAKLEVARSVMDELYREWAGEDPVKQEGPGIALAEQEGQAVQVPEIIVKDEQ